MHEIFAGRSLRKTLYMYIYKAQVSENNEVKKIQKKKKKKKEACPNIF